VIPRKKKLDQAKQIGANRTFNRLYSRELKRICKLMQEPLEANAAASDDSTVGKLRMTAFWLGWSPHLWRSGRSAASPLSQRRQKRPCFARRTPAPPVRTATRAPVTLACGPVSAGPVQLFSALSSIRDRDRASLPPLLPSGDRALSAPHPPSAPPSPPAPPPAGFFLSVALSQLSRPLQLSVAAAQRWYLSSTPPTTTPPCLIANLIWP
jgi:hypothetical protein